MRRSWARLVQTQFISYKQMGRCVGSKSHRSSGLHDPTTLHWQIGRRCENDKIITSRVQLFVFHVLDDGSWISVELLVSSLGLRASLASRIHSSRYGIGRNKITDFCACNRMTPTTQNHCERLFSCCHAMAFRAFALIAAATAALTVRTKHLSGGRDDPASIVTDWQN